MDTIDYDDRELKNEFIQHNYIQENKNNVYAYNSLNNPLNPFIITNNIIEDKNKLYPHIKDKKKIDTKIENNDKHIQFISSKDLKLENDNTKETIKNTNIGLEINKVFIEKY